MECRSFYYLSLLIVFGIFPGKHACMHACLGDGVEDRGGQSVPTSNKSCSVKAKKESSLDILQDTSNYSPTQEKSGWIMHRV